MRMIVQFLFLMLALFACVDAMGRVDLPTRTGSLYGNSYYIPDGTRTDQTHDAVCQTATISHFAAAGAFGNAVFIEGDAEAQARFGAGLAEVFGGGATARIARQGLNVADQGARIAGQQAVSLFDNLLLSTLPNRGSPGMRIVQEAGDGGNSLRMAEDLLLRSRAGQGILLQPGC